MDIPPISNEPQHIGSPFYRKILIAGGIASGLVGIAYLTLTESGSDLERSQNQATGLSAVIGSVITLTGAVVLAYCTHAPQTTAPVKERPPLSDTYIEAAQDIISEKTVEKFEQLLADWKDWKKQYSDPQEFAKMISDQTPVEGMEQPPFVTLCQILQGYYDVRTSVFPMKVFRMDGNPDYRSPQYDVVDDLHTITVQEQAFYKDGTLHAHLRKMYNSFIDENQNIADFIEDQRYQSYFVRDELEPSQDTTQFLTYRGMLPS